MCKACQDRHRRVGIKFIGAVHIWHPVICLSKGGHLHIAVDAKDLAHGNLFGWCLRHIRAVGHVLPSLIIRALVADSFRLRKGAGGRLKIASKRKKETYEASVRHEFSLSAMAKGLFEI